MSGKILIAYGTRYGSTTEIAEKMSKALKKKGFDALPLNLGEVEKREWPSPEEYDGVIVGTGIRAGKWTSSAKKFLKRNSEKFKGEESIPLGLFVSAATAIDEPEKAKESYLEKMIEKYDLNVDSARAFPGVLDFSDSSEVGFLGRKMLKLAAKRMTEEGTEIDMEERNDYRDWDEIEEFAVNFAEKV